MADIYEQHAKAFDRVSAFVITRDGERVATIRDSGSTASIFAALRDYIPDDNGAVYEWIRG